MWTLKNDQAGQSLPYEIAMSVGAGQMRDQRSVFAARRIDDERQVRGDGALRTGGYHRREHVRAHGFEYLLARERSIFRLVVKHTSSLVAPAAPASGPWGQKARAVLQTIAQAHRAREPDACAGTLASAPLATRPGCTEPRGVAFRSGPKARGLVSCMKHD